MKTWLLLLGVLAIYLGATGKYRAVIEAARR